MSIDCCYYLTSGDVVSSIPQNLGAWLRDAEHDRFLRQFLRMTEEGGTCEWNADPEFLSDYEYFCVYCACFPYIKNTITATRDSTVFRFLLGMQDEPPCPEWWKNFNASRKGKQIDFPQPIAIPVIHVSENSVHDWESFPEELTKQILCGDSITSRLIVLSLPMPDEFVRPDLYHAQKALETKSGERSLHDEALIFGQLLRQTAVAAQNTGIPILLKHPSSAVEQYAAYLEECHHMPNIWVRADDSSVADVISFRHNGIYPVLTGLGDLKTMSASNLVHGFGFLPSDTVRYSLLGQWYLKDMIGEQAYTYMCRRLGKEKESIPC